MALISLLVPVLVLSVTMNILGWWEKKIKKEKKQKKAEAKAKLKAGKKAKRAKKDSKKADLEEQRASRQVPGQGKEPRMTWGMLRAQEQAARRDHQLIQEKLHDLAKEMESSRQEVRSPDWAGSSTTLHELAKRQRKEWWAPGNEAMRKKMTARDMLNHLDKALESSRQELLSPDWAGSSTTLHELVEQQRKEWWAPGNEAIREKMTAREMLENMPRPLQLSSSDSLWDSDQEALEQKPAKVRSQEPTAVQEMSAASSPSSKRPLQSPERWKQPGKEQSQASRKQQQPGAATPQAQEPRSSLGKKLRKCLAQIWFCLKCCFCSCFCPCLLHRAQKRNRLP